MFPARKVLILIGVTMSAVVSTAIMGVMTHEPIDADGATSVEPQILLPECAAGAINPYEVLERTQFGSWSAQVSAFPGFGINDRDPDRSPDDASKSVRKCCEFDWVFREVCIPVMVGGGCSPGLIGNMDANATCDYFRFCYYDTVLTCVRKVWFWQSC